MSGSGLRRDMEATITTERPDTADARALIDELEAHLATLYPRECRHGYSVEKLITQGVAFFLVRDNGTPVGCGGIQLFRTDYGELKRMYAPSTVSGFGFCQVDARSSLRLRPKPGRQITAAGNRHSSARCYRIVRARRLSEYSAFWRVQGRPAQQVL